MSSNSIPYNIRDFMRTQRRERAAAKLMEKQKTESDRRRILKALENVQMEADAARRSLHKKSGGGDGLARDRVGSYTTTSTGRPKMVVKQQTQLPPSDITRYVDDCGIGNTSSALCRETRATTTKSGSIATKDSAGLNNCTCAAPHTEDATTAENDCDAATRNLKLDTRRQWELEPLQDALHRFALVGETVQHLIDPHPLESNFQSNMLLLERKAGREISGIPLNRGSPRRTVTRRASTHSAISLCLHDFNYENYPQPHIGRKDKAVCDNYAAVFAKHEAKVRGVTSDTKKGNPLSTSEEFVLDPKLSSSKSYPIDDKSRAHNHHINQTFFHNSKISSQIESNEEDCEDAVGVDWDSNANNEGKADGGDRLALTCSEESVDSDDDYESSFLSED
ncbi:hypothetical protein HJC23_008566 [Cyclotella cryptica]|uniref:Uncharacterized protein n=1 Tax=Cyclotella cryptica TaxID=29204 RepID=A0ABD3PNA5_9STRA